MLDKPAELPKISGININKLAKSNESLEKDPADAIDRFDERFSNSQIDRSNSNASNRSTLKRDQAEGFLSIQCWDLVNLISTMSDGIAMHNNKPVAPLIIDLRSSDKFSDSHLVDSVNPQFPSLLIKRFKSRKFANFSILNFLQDKMQHRIVERWKSIPQQKLIVAYCENNLDYGNDRDIWAVLNAFRAANTSDPNLIIAYVEGGYESISSTEGISKYLNHGIPSTSSINSKPSDGIRNQSQSRMSERSALSIDVTTTKKRAPTPSLAIMRSPANDLATSPSPAMTAITDSATEQSFPAHPFSFITENVIVGSDEVPQSITGPSRLSEIGVTHILNMASEIKHSKWLHDSQLFTLKWIPVHDNTEVDLDDALNEAISFIGIMN